MSELVSIKGIFSRYSNILIDNGINTLEKLSQANESDLKDALVSSQFDQGPGWRVEAAQQSTAARPLAAGVRGPRPCVAMLPSMPIWP